MRRNGITLSPRVAGICTVLAAGLIACESAVEPELWQVPVFGFGNGAPSGSHYNLNIIGVPNTKTADMGGGGNVIFVGLGSDLVAVTTRINLCESGTGAACANLDPSTYLVLDKNGTDDGIASFALPNPAPNFDPTIPNSDIPSVYSVYVRPLGKPGGLASNKTCGEVVVDPTTGATEVLCSIVQMRIDRYKGKQAFIDATRCLLYIYADLNPLDGVTTISRAPIFGGDAGLSAWWEYTNNGLKLAQLRFYPLPGDVPAPSTTVTDCTNKK